MAATFHWMCECDVLANHLYALVCRVRLRGACNRKCEVATSNMSLLHREKPSASAVTVFVRGGEALASPNRRKKGDVIATYGSAAFTAEETISIYGILVSLPSEVMLRTQLVADVNPAVLEN